MNEEILFADQTVLQKSDILKSSAWEIFVYIRHPGLNIRQVFEILTDARKTREITVRYGETVEGVYTGYTELVSIRKEDSGQYTAILQKAVG